MFDTGKIRVGFIRLTVIIDNDDFIIGIAGFACQTLNAAREEIQTIARQNDNGYLLCRSEFPLDPIRVCAPVHGNVTRDAFPLEVLVHGAPGGFELAGLLPNADRAGICTSPPMVQHPRNVMNPISLLDDTKKEVVILCAVEF